MITHDKWNTNEESITSVTNSENEKNRFEMYYTIQYTYVRMHACTHTHKITKKPDYIIKRL